MTYKASLRWLLLRASFAALACLIGCAPVAASGGFPGRSRIREAELQRSELVALRDLINWRQLRRSDGVVFVSDAPFAYRVTNWRHSSEWIQEALTLPPIRGLCQAIPCDDASAEYQVLLFVGIDSVVDSRAVYVTIANQVARRRNGALTIIAHNERELLLRMVGHDWQVVWRAPAIYDDFGG